MNVYENKHQLGAHTSFSGSLSNTIWSGVNYGMYALQFFLGSPQGFNRATISDEDMKNAKKILERFPTKVFSHFPYVANLAGSKDSLAWAGDTIQDNKTLHVLKGLSYELNVLSEIEGGVVIHAGNYPNEEKGLWAIAQSIEKITFSKNALLLLENSAGQGTSLTTTLLQIRKVIDLVSLEKRKHLGVCIDTCHTFAYGDYDLSKVSEMYRLFTDFDQIIGASYLKLIHLNDSETPLKSRKDRHACIGTGHIWGKNFDSLKVLLKICKERDIPCVLETHGLDMITIASINSENHSDRIN